jgi:hypothetical protein
MKRETLEKLFEWMYELAFPVIALPLFLLLWNITLGTIIWMLIAIGYTIAFAIVGKLNKQ